MRFEMCVQLNKMKLEFQTHFLFIFIKNRLEHRQRTVRHNKIEQCNTVAGWVGTVTGATLGE